MTQHIKRFFAGCRAFMEAAFFSSQPTVIEDVVQRTHKATLDVMHCNVAIDKARYQRHMALNELRALEDWNHQRNVLEVMQ